MILLSATDIPVGRLMLVLIPLAIVWLTLRYVEIAVLELEPRELVSRGCECGGDFPYL